jgi:hypothetical protein
VLGAFRFFRAMSTAIAQRYLAVNCRDSSKG